MIVSVYIEKALSDDLEGAFVVVLFTMRRLSVQKECKFKFQGCGCITILSTITLPFLIVRELIDDVDGLSE